MPFCVNCGAMNINDPVICTDCGKRFSGKKAKTGGRRTRTKTPPKQKDDFVITAPAKKRKPKDIKITKFFFLNFKIKWLHVRSI